VNFARGRKLVPGGERVFQRMYTRLGCTGRPPRFIVEYHPYVGLTHTIRVREDTVWVRLSDALQRSPRGIIEAAAAILLGKLHRKHPPADLVEAYRQFSYARRTRRQLQAMRQRRARGMEHRPVGAQHDLARLFNRLNRRYFDNALTPPRLGWSARSWRAQLGCFDPALNQIIINRRLDDRAVPEYVVAYVLFHEMLHQKHPMRFARCRRESHSVAFRREEKRFPAYTRAMKFLKRFRAE
jgi:predicted metal-dependent hydrolase